MRIFIAILFSVLVLAACTTVTPPSTADDFMQQGDAFLAKKRYDEAIASWEKAREAYVSPETNAIAELKIADARFLAEQYVEAAVAYEAFLKQHPDHASTADVLHRLGVAYFMEIRSPERDQTTTRNALATFETLLNRFPADPRQDEIKKRIAHCQNQLAAHELHVGAYYLRKAQYAAAINRLQPLVEGYPEFSGRDELYYRLGAAYLGNSQRLQAEETFDRLSREYPQSSFLAKALKLLKDES